VEVMLVFVTHEKTDGLTLSNVHINFKKEKFKFDVCNKFRKIENSGCD
jgi:hypothetical protein